MGPTYYFMITWTLRVRIGIRVPGVQFRAFCLRSRVRSQGRRIKSQRMVYDFLAPLQRGL